MEPKIIVVGAGIAGLTAAYQLQKQGYSVTVLESANHPGGRIYTERTGDFIVDAGAQFLSSGFTTIFSLIDQLGLSSELVEVSPYSAIVRNGVPRKICYRDPHTLFASGLLTLRDWSRYGFRSTVTAIRKKHLPLNDYSAWHRFDDKESQEWYPAEFGSDVYNYVIEPTLEGFYFQSPTGTSRALPMAVSMFPMRGHKMYTLSGGLDTLPKALAKSLDVRLNAAVRSIKIKTDKVIVSTADSEMESDYLILATPAVVARALFQDAAPIEQRVMSTQYSSTVNIAIGTSGLLQSGWAKGVYGFLIPGVERNAIASVAIESNKSRDRAPKGELFNVMLADKPGAELIHKSDDEILKTIMPELERYFAKLSGSITYTRVFRWPEAEPRSPVGRAKLIQSYRASNHDQSRRIFLAGDYLSMPFTEGAAESGMWAARQIHSKHL